MRDQTILDALAADPAWFARKVASRLNGYPDPSACWEWTGATTKRHGVVRLPSAGVTALTHRVVWLALVGSIPDGLVLDHDGPDGCHNRACANPAHLQAVTVRTNTNNGPFTNACKTHCKRGHLLGADNVNKAYARRGFRTCRQCGIEGHRTLARAARLLGMTKEAYCASYGWSVRVAQELIATRTVERTA